MRIVCQQTILMKYHALFVIFEKVAKFYWRLLQNIGGALRAKSTFKLNFQWDYPHLLQHCSFVISVIKSPNSWLIYP